MEIQASENHPANGIVPWRTIADRVLAAVRSHLDAQRQANAGELIGEFCEIESGRRSDRPQLAAAIVAAKKARATLIIAKLDRLARNVHFISGLMESGVDFVAADNPHANKLMVHMLAAFAEHEREQIQPKDQRRSRSGQSARDQARPQCCRPIGPGLPGGGNGASPPGGTYQVTKRLPENDGEFEYQIKNVEEPYVRVAREGELTKA